MATEVSSYLRGSQPYSCIGYISATFPDGSNSRGTCTLVGRNDILTATHVVYSPDNGGWATNFDFYFGADYNDITGRFEDYGYQYLDPQWKATAWPNQTFTDGDNETLLKSEAKFDIAMIGVADPIGDTLGWLGLDPGYNGSYSANAVGYPAGATGMMQENVNVQKNSTNEIYESVSLVMGPGSSGGPLLEGNYVIGVKSTGSWWSDVGTLFSQLTDFMDSNNSMLGAIEKPTYTVISNASTSSTAIGEGSSVTFTITRSGNITDSSIVYWGTQAGSASAGAGDYPNFGSTNSLTFVANETAKTVTIQTSLDALIEGIENFYLNIYENLTDATNYNYSSRGIAYIKDAVADLTPPTVITFSPADEATNVPVYSNIALNFSEAIARGNGNIILKTSSGSVVATYDVASSSNLSISGSNLTLNPTADLAAGTAYQVEFAFGSIKDLAGNPFAGTISYNFTTASATPAPNNKIYGTDGNDVLKSPSDTTSSYVLYGQNGDDSLYGGKGDDSLYGGKGIDTAVYKNTYSSYHIEKLYASKGSSSGIKVSGGTQEGTDFISTDVEYLQFADGRATLSQGTVTFSPNKIDSIAPTVTTFAPADEATGVAVGSNIVLTFNESIARGTGNIVLKTASGSVVATYNAADSSNLSISGSTLTLDPSADLAAGSGYNIEFAAGSIKDLAGNAYAGTTSYNFTTIARILGTSGNDRLAGGSGVPIDGVAGIDTVTYAGNRGSMIHNPDGTWTVGSDTLNNIERLLFADKKVALDIDGNAGIVAKILASVFGAAAVSNKEYAGIGLNLIDGGMTYEALSALAINAAGAKTREAVVDRLWTNLMGSHPTAAQAQPFIDMLAEDLSNVGSLGVIAADYAATVGVVDLGALGRTGLEYI